MKHKFKIMKPQRTLLECLLILLCSKQFECRSSIDNRLLFVWNDIKHPYMGKYLNYKVCRVEGYILDKTPYTKIWIIN